jgi:hypothetical protein
VRRYNKEASPLLLEKFLEKYPVLFEELALARLDPTVVRCRLTVSNPVLKPPVVPALETKT